jgi:hypothetical protein
VRKAENSYRHRGYRRKLENKEYYRIKKSTLRLTKKEKYTQEDCWRSESK